MIENLLTRHYFNGQAQAWGSGRTYQKEKIESLLSRLDFWDSHTILDIGCGTGALFPFLEKFTQGRAKIFAIDFAEMMAQKAAQKKYSSITILCGCARYLPFEDNSIDLIIAFQVFPHIQGKSLALKECWRVLKPYGELAIIHVHSSSEITAIHHQIGGAVKEHVLPSAGTMADLLNAAGFFVKTAIDRSGEYYVDGIKNHESTHHHKKIATDEKSTLILSSQ